MENLGIDSKLLIAQLINFGVFFFVFQKFLAKPFMKFLKEEKAKDQEKEKIFAKAKTMEEKLTEKEKQMKADMRKESDALMQEAKKSAEKVRAQLLEEAHKEVEDLKKAAHKQMEQERSDIERQAQEKISQVSFFIVNEALKDVLTDDLRKKISDNIVKHSTKSVRFYEN